MDNTRNSPENMHLITSNSEKSMKNTFLKQALFQ